MGGAFVPAIWGWGRRSRIDSPERIGSIKSVNLNIALEQPDKKLALFGSADRHLRMIRDTFGVQIVNREDELRVAGERDQVSKAVAVLEQLQKKLRRQDWLSADDVGKAIGS